MHLLLFLFHAMSGTHRSLIPIQPTCTRKRGRCCPSLERKPLTYKSYLCDPSWIPLVVFPLFLLQKLRGVLALERWRKTKVFELYPCCAQGTSRDSLSTGTFSGRGPTFRWVGYLAVENCAHTAETWVNCYFALWKQVLSPSRLHG